MENKTKLTLSCSPKVVEEAKNYASDEGESLSSVVEDLLVSYIKIKKGKQEGKYPFHAPKISELSGAFKLGKHRDYKEEYKQ